MNPQIRELEEHATETATFVETALKLCPGVFLMEKGTIVHSGSSSDLKSQPEIVHRYLGLSK